MWTAKSPNQVTLRRLVMCAADSYGILLKALCSRPGTASVHVSAAFEPALEDFPVVIRLRPSALPRRDGSCHGSILPSTAAQWLLSSALLSNSEATQQKLTSSFVVDGSGKHGTQLLCGFSPLESFIKARSSFLLHMMACCTSLSRGIPGDSRMSWKAAGAVLGSAMPHHSWARVAFQSFSNAPCWKFEQSFHPAKGCSQHASSAEEREETCSSRTPVPCFCRVGRSPEGHGYDPPRVKSASRRVRSSRWLGH